MASRFNELITSRLVEGAGDCLRRHGVAPDDIAVVWVPGAFEIPLAARRVAEQGRFDAVVCLGAVIEGATDHHEYVAGNAAAGIARESAAADVPMTFGIITAASIEQAIERAGTKQGNLGWNAAPVSPGDDQCAAPHRMSWQSTKKSGTANLRRTHDHSYHPVRQHRRPEHCCRASSTPPHAV